MAPVDMFMFETSVVGSTAAVNTAKRPGVVNSCGRGVDTLGDLVLMICLGVCAVLFVTCYVTSSP